MRRAPPRAEIELQTIDLRYESFRLKSPAKEAHLLASISERGVEEPLEGVEACDDGTLSGSRLVLLNGFKRYRCARRLGLQTVPFVTIGEDEASAILALLRAAKSRSLDILEEASFLQELERSHKLTRGELAELAGRSKSWVSMRLGLLQGMTEGVREKIFSGAFPVYAYMYMVRRFMRMNDARKGGGDGDGEGQRPSGRKEDVERFVDALSRKKLSVREIEQLADGYFRGPESFREEIHAENLALVLGLMKDVPQSPEGVSGQERAFLRELRTAEKYMARVVARSPGLGGGRFTSRAFHSQANLLGAGILSRLGAFKKAIEELYDRSANAPGDLPPA